MEFWTFVNASVTALSRALGSAFTLAFKTI
jgi:hypothetical protein